MSACIVVPVNYHASGSRRSVSQSNLEIAHGVTTKEEILLKFGEPDFASHDGSRYGYAWTKVKALVIWGSNSTGGMTELTRSYILEFTFGESNLVKNTRIVQEWAEQVALESELSLKHNQ